MRTEQSRPLFVKPGLNPPLLHPRSGGCGREGEGWGQTHGITSKINYFLDDLDINETGFLEITSMFLRNLKGCSVARMVLKNPIPALVVSTWNVIKRES